MKLINEDPDDLVCCKCGNKDPVCVDEEGDSHDVSYGAICYWFTIHVVKRYNQMTTEH